MLIGIPVTTNDGPYTPVVLRPSSLVRGPWSIVHRPQEEFHTHSWVQSAVRERAASRMNSFESAVRRRYTIFAMVHGSSFRANGHTEFGFAMRTALLRYVFGKHLEEGFAGRSVDVLDSGCGNSCMAPVLRELFTVRHLDGFDFGPDQVSVAQRMYGYRSARVGHVLDVASCFPGVYDLVLSSEVFYFVPPLDRIRFWRDHLGRLNDTGRMLVLLPNNQSFVRRRRPFGNRFPFTVDTLIEDVGAFPEFEIESISGINMLTRSCSGFRLGRRNVLWRLGCFVFCAVVGRRVKGEG